jgi:hypothetical protein
MSVSISIGSIVSGKSGKPLKVLAVNGDVLDVLGDTSSFKVRRSAILKVIPPRPKAFKLGDRVTYIGSDFNLKTQYAGTLKVWEISKNPYDGYTCLKPNGRTTSWIQFEDLELVNAIEVTPIAGEVEGDLWA